MTADEVLARHFRAWSLAACAEWNYSAPDDAFYRRVRARLTDDVLEWIGAGLEAGLINEHGLRFNVAGKPANRRYKWFSERTGAIEPQCNWEYYVQVACFVQLWQPCRAAGLDLAFEDRLMDVAVSRAGRVWWCVEVKEGPRHLERLLAEVAAHGQRGVGLDGPDRGKDPLRKAKYLVRYQPPFFSGVAIGVKRDLRVTYGPENRFTLTPCAPPVPVAVRPPSG